jgi:hypothetical protein
MNWSNFFGMTRTNEQRRSLDGGMRTLNAWPNAGWKSRILGMVMLGWAGASAFAQHPTDMELDLKAVPVERGVKGGAVVKGGGTLLPPLGLPFVDDFAWPSMYHEDAPVNAKRWEPSPVRRTMTLALNPPTVGCATLEGLDGGGRPYTINPVNPAGYADTLTSRRLLLGNNLDPSDSVALTFWYQSGGVANGADAGEDSLIVEFRTSVAQGDPWRWVWSTEGVDDDTTFSSVTIPIVGPEYFHNDFQFRFRNYGSLEGNVDTWHVDYVSVRANGMTPMPEEEEISFVSTPSSFLVYPWTAMPWPHYKETPGMYVADEVVTTHRSFGSTSNSQQNIGLKIQRVDAVGNVAEYTPPPGNIPNNGVTGLFETDYIGEMEIFGQLFNPAVSDTFATFHVSLWETEVGGGNGTNRAGLVDNDSLVHVQTFRDYYAYDDGSAEKAYALDGIGGELAVRFDIQQPDTLDGVWIHFTPFFDDASGDTFVLKVRGEDPQGGSAPGGELGEQYQLHQPTYFTDGYDDFVYYPLDAPLPVEGTVFVGLLQQDDTRLNVGLDKTTNTNTDYLWYKFPSLGWQQSTISGSLMIRPVLRAGKELVTSTFEHRATRAPEVFPNPGRHTCHLRLESFTDIRVMDIRGHVVADLPRCQPGLFSWQTDVPGMYLLVGRDAQGRTWTTRWIANP